MNFVAGIGSTIRCSVVVGGGVGCEMCHTRPTSQEDLRCFCKKKNEAVVNASSYFSVPVLLQQPQKNQNSDCHESGYRIQSTACTFLIFHASGDDTARIEQLNTDQHFTHYRQLVNHHSKKAYNYCFNESIYFQIRGSLAGM
jgi:hypothetical protein